MPSSKSRPMASLVSRRRASLTTALHQLAARVLAGIAFAWAAAALAPIALLTPTSVSAQVFPLAASAYPGTLARGSDLSWGMNTARQSPEPQVRWPNGEYRETHTDLSVKVLGGSVDITRSWSQGRWWLNAAWAPLNFELDPLGRDVKVIERAGTLYQRSGQSGLYIATDKLSAPVYIRRAPDANGQVTDASGWQWYDRLGNTIDYSKAGLIQSYANASGVKVSFAYDSATRARILDHFGTTIYTATMAGGLITRIQDAAGRSVRYDWSGQRLVKVTDLLGIAWTYEYDANGQITSRTDPVGAKTLAQYSQSVPAPAPMLTLGAAGITLDPTGTSGTTQKLQNTWGAGRVGVLTSQGTSNSGQTSYLRQKRQFEITFTDRRGNRTIYIYDLQGNELSRTFNGKPAANTQWDGDYLSRQVDARGNTTTTKYDSNRQPLQIIHPDGSQESYTYEPVRGQRVRHTDPLGTVSTWAYDGKGRVTQWVEALGLPEQRTSSYVYDPYGQLTSKSRGAGDGDGADKLTWQFAYDNAGNVTQTTDPTGRVTQTAYDSRGLPTSQTDPLGRTTQLSFDAAGHLLKATNPLGQSVQHQYDALGRRVQTTSAAGKVQTTRYDLYGRVIESIAPGQTQGGGTRAEYDAYGQPVKLTSPGGLTSQASYDELGRVTSTTDSAGNVTTYSYGADDTAQARLLIAVQYPTFKETYGYDQRGRQTLVTQHLSQTDTRTQHQTYDAIGRRVAVTDAAGRTTAHQYDALGRLVQTTDPLAQTTRQTWSAHDQLLSVTDAKGNTHRFDYDKALQLVKETRPLGGATQLQYDAAGQLTQRTDAGGNTRSYGYDQAGRLTQQEHKLAGTTVDEAISYSYDADGRMSGYVQKDGSDTLISSASYSRDAQGRTTQSAISYGKMDSAGTDAGTLSFTLGQGFNADGQLASHTYPDGSTGTYAYDLGRLSQVTLPDGSQVNYQNYQWTAPTRIQTPGATKSLTFDALQRSTNIEVKSNGANNPTTLTSRSYQYDTAGNITRIDSDRGTTQYGYDSLDRLTQASPDQSLQSLGLPVEQYGYDAVHNRISSAHQPGVWSYNADNQLTQYPRIKPFEAAATTPPQQTQLTYTPQGHTKTQTNSPSDKSYGYNAGERLTRYTETAAGQTSAAVQASYRYDPSGRRISKILKEGQASRATYFLYSDTGLLGEADEQGHLTKAYGFNPTRAQQGLWSTDPVWQADTGNGSSSLTAATTRFHYLHTDHLGTPILATNKLGATTWAGVAEAFGATGVSQNQSAITMNLRLPGQYFDAETLSHQNLFRDYMPTIGRYMESDLIGLVGGINMYNYVGGNPLSYSDSNGLRIFNPYGASVSDEVLEALREFNKQIGCDKDIFITGGNRKASSKLGAGSKSMHAQGLAADIRVRDQTHLETANQARLSSLFTGIGWYEEGYAGPNGEGPHAHVDIRTSNPSAWGFDKNGKQYHGNFPVFSTNQRLNPSSIQCMCE